MQMGGRALATTAAPARGPQRKWARTHRPLRSEPRRSVRPRDRPAGAFRTQAQRQSAPVRLPTRDRGRRSFASPVLSAVGFQDAGEVLGRDERGGRSNERSSPLASRGGWRPLPGLAGWWRRRCGCQGRKLPCPCYSPETMLAEVGRAVDGRRSGLFGEHISAGQKLSRNASSGSGGR